MREKVLVDWLSREADIVTRFQGGHIVGHIIDGITYTKIITSLEKIKYLLLETELRLTMGLTDEIEEGMKKANSMKNLILSAAATLILLFTEVDEIREDLLANQNRNY